MKTTNRTNGKQTVVKYKRSRNGVAVSSAQISALAQAMSMQTDGTLDDNLEANFERAFQLLVTCEQKLKQVQEET
jgi:hypothetical protein